MQIKQTVEYEVDQIVFSINKPDCISLHANHPDVYLPKFFELELKDKDLQLSKDFCEMLKRNLLDKFS